MTSAGFKEGLQYTENIKAVIEKFMKMKQTPIQAEGRTSTSLRGLWQHFEHLLRLIEAKLSVALLQPLPSMLARVLIKHLFSSEIPSGF